MTDETLRTPPRLRRSFLLSMASSGSAVLLLVLIARAAVYLSPVDFGVLSYALILAAITETLIDDSSKRQTMGRAAVETAARFDEDAIMLAFDQIIDEVAR